MQMKVHFVRTTHALFASKAKIDVFEKKILMEGPRRRLSMKKKVTKNIILAFEVIMQQPNNTFEIGFFFAF